MHIGPDRASSLTLNQRCLFSSSKSHDPALLPRVREKCFALVTDELIATRLVALATLLDPSKHCMAQSFCAVAQNVLV